MLEAGVNWLARGEAVALLGVLALATAGTGVLFLIGLGAYARRRTEAYLLLAVAIGLLLVRSLVGLGTALGHVPMPVHHLLEHGFDFLIAVIVLGAAYRAGPVGPTA